MKKHAFRLLACAAFCLSLILLLAISVDPAMAVSGHAGIVAPANTSSFSFQLHPNPATFNCLAQFPTDPARPPTGLVKLTHGRQTDTLRLSLSNIKPNLVFDLFTVEISNLKPDGSADSAFQNFGLAWYQSEIAINAQGTAAVAISIKTILADEIFGFDPAKKLNPTGTFHVGFWFDDPADAAACGFKGKTPFNDVHDAGPVAMISVPDAASNLGPLCRHPDTSTIPATCKP